MAHMHAGVMAKPSAAFTPAAIAGLGLWLDASDASSFTYSSGAVVSQWNDKSGNARHATQGTVGLQPSRSGTQNSLATVVFNVHALTCGDVLDVATSSISVFSVAKKTNNVTSHVIIGKYKAGPNAGSWLHYFERGGGNPYFSTSYKPTSTLGTASESANATTSHRVLSSVIDRAAGSIAQYVDGSAAGTASFTSDSATNQNNAQAVWLGSLRDVTDTGFYGGYGLIGEIAEIVIYQSALSATDRQSVEAYLKAKWGTA